MSRDVALFKHAITSPNATSIPRTASHTNSIVAQPLPSNLAPPKLVHRMKYNVRESRDLHVHIDRRCSELSIAGRCGQAVLGRKDC